MPDTDPAPVASRISLAFALVALVLTTSCGKKEEPPAASSTPPPQTSATAPRSQASAEPFSSGKRPPSTAGRSAAGNQGPPKRIEAKGPGNARTTTPGSVTRSSAYSTAPPPVPGQKNEPKPLPPADEADTAKASTLAEKSRASGAGSNDMLPILNEARSLHNEALLPVVGGLLTSTDPSIRGQALGLLEGYNSSKVLPIAAQALKDPDVDVRLEAVAVAKTVASPDTANLLLATLNDPDREVRQAAFQAAMDQGAEARTRVLFQAAASPYTDLAIGGLTFLRSMNDKSYVPQVIGALGHQDPLVRDLAHEILYLTFQADLKTPSDAGAWWTTNQGNFDQNLQPKNTPGSPFVIGPAK